MARRKIDKAALASLIRESKELNNDQKADLLQLLNEQKRYGLVWEEHKEDAEELLTENIPILIEEESKRILSPSSLREGRGGSPNHILIEGDNLHALTALTYTHEGKVDVIYIDPPYNTGNKDFVYNDSYVDSEDGYRHSKWLSFMEKRLRIAKKLLSDKGVIFISIDDNEQANLKLLCDEVFGESNFISNFIWKSRQNKDNRNISGVSNDHEYIVCYTKIQAIRALRGSERKVDQYKNPDNDPRGPWTSANMAGILDAEQRPNCHYDLIDPATGINYGKPKMGWRYDRNTMNRLISENRILWPSSPDGRPRKKTFLAEISVVLPGFSSVVGEDLYTRNGTKVLDDIFEKRPFDYPKPTELIEEFIRQSSKKHSLILDFFAGSGTTLHATMQLNAEDGGHRQCILVTNNENNICEEVTYERNKRVINGYTTPKGVEVPGLTNNNLRYYKTVFVPREKTAANRRKLMQMATDMLCIKENMYNEQPFEIDGKKMKPEFVRYFVSDAKDMIIIYDPRAIAFVAKALPHDSQKKIMVYVYSDGQYAYNDEFHGKNIELCALPDAIYQALSRVLPPQKEVKLLNSSPRGGQEGAL